MLIRSVCACVCPAFETRIVFYWWFLEMEHIAVVCSFWVVYFLNFLFVIPHYISLTHSHTPTTTISLTLPAAILLK